MSEKSEAIRYIIATIFSAQNALRSLAPEFKWTGLGNLLKDYCECIAIKNYDFTKAESGAFGYDAINKRGDKIQIKANYASNLIWLNGEADLLLVIKIKVEGTWDDVYFGDFLKALSIANYSKRDNKYSISITALRKII